MYNFDVVKATIERKEKEIKMFPNACAYTDCIRTELNSLIVFARREYGQQALDLLPAPQFDKFNKRDEAEYLSQNSTYISKMLDKEVSYGKA